MSLFIPLNRSEISDGIGFVTVTEVCDSPRIGMCRCKRLRKSTVSYYPSLVLPTNIPARSELSFMESGLLVSSKQVSKMSRCSRMDEVIH